MRADVTLDDAFDLDVARGLHVADDLQVGGKHGDARLRLRRGHGIVEGRLGRSRFSSLGLVGFCAGFRSRFVDPALRKHCSPP